MPERTSEVHLDKGLITGWYCKCDNFYNDILTRYCRSCYALRYEYLEPLQAKIFLQRRGNLVEPDGKPMDDTRLEMHVKFFNAEKPLYAAMTLDERISHRKELEDIALQAKARISAMDYIEREENDNLPDSVREWKRTQPKSINVSDALNEVKLRKSRMNKADKLKSQMEKLGVQGIDGIMNHIQKRATDAQIDGIKSAKKESNGSEAAKKPDTEIDLDSLDFLTD